MQIATQRLLLRDFTAADWTAVLAYQSHPLYLRYYPWTERTAEDVQAFVKMFLAHQQMNPRHKFQLAVTLKSSGQLIGNCGIRLPEPESIEADLGYELDPAHWGQGYATEAARAMLHFGFTGLGLHRIWASVLAVNEGSVRLLQKLGFKQEGHLREKEYFKGQYWDSLIFGLLATEWNHHQGADGSKPYEMLSR